MLQGQLICGVYELWMIAEYDQQLQECKILKGDIFWTVTEDPMPIYSGKINKV